MGEKLNKHCAINLKSFLLMFAIGICFNVNGAFAADNVLQAIQVDGAKDSYNIILKSDDVAELRKTIQAPNKMVLDLKGIRASKTINTIYNNTSSVDSVVVEPTGDDSVRVLVQADNVGNANVHFDTLKTPLGVLDSSTGQKKNSGEIVLNGPMESYKPVYDKSSDSEETGFSLSKAMGPMAGQVKDLLKNKKISWMITIGLFVMLVLNGLKNFKNKDNDIKIGLTQSLKDREIDLYKDSDFAGSSAMKNLNSGSANIAGVNYGLKAYQNGSRSPYATPEIQRPRVSNTPAAGLQQQMTKSVQTKSALQSSMKNTNLSTMQKPALKTAPNTTRNKTTNIDSIKFLESMTKIYEKNGRSDLAQGLKANIKKAKTNLV